MTNDLFINQTVKDKEELLKAMQNTVGLELHCEDFDPVRKFYQSIGFEILFDSPGNYLTLRLGTVILSFWGDGGRFDDQPYFKNFSKDNKKGYAVEIIVPVKNVAAYYEMIKDKVTVTTPLKKKRWGANDFRIEDVNGFYIRFTEPHDWIFSFQGYSSNKDS